jgi:hypothetical protein
MPMFSCIPSEAALAMDTMSVMFGVIFTKNGIFMAALTHWHMLRTRSGSYTPETNIHTFLIFFMGVLYLESFTKTKSIQNIK